MATIRGSADRAELPVGWRWRPLRSLTAEYFSGKRPKGGVAKIQEGPLSLGGEHLTWSGTVDLTTPRRIPETFADAMADSEVAPDDILIVKDGATTGKTAFVSSLPERAFVNEHVFVLRPTEEILPKYLFYWLWSCPGFDQIMLDFRGAAQGGIGRTFIDKVSVPWAPVPTQCRMVAQIDELFSEVDDGEEDLRRARVDLETYRKSLLKAAVMGELTADWRAANVPKETGADLLQRILAKRRAGWEADQKNKGKRYKEPSGPDPAGLPKLPKGWAWATVRQISEYLTSGSRGWSKFYSPSGATFIRAQDINRDVLDLKEVAHVTLPEGAEGVRSRVHQGDLLVTITGANVTKTAHVHQELDEAYVSQHVALLRLSEWVSSAFVWLWLITPATGRKQLEKAAYGAGKPGLNLPNILDVKIALPPHCEQNEIRRVTQRELEIASEILALAHRPEELTELRQSILAAAFRGELVQ